MRAVRAEVLQDALEAIVEQTVRLERELVALTAQRRFIEGLLEHVEEVTTVETFEVTIAEADTEGLEVATPEDEEDEDELEDEGVEEDLEDSPPLPALAVPSPHLEPIEGEVWEKVGRPEHGLQGWSSSEDRTVVLEEGEHPPGLTVYQPAGRAIERQLRANGGLTPAMKSALEKLAETRGWLTTEGLVRGRAQEALVKRGLVELRVDGARRELRITKTGRKALR